jgi:hypothetical protein
LLKVGSHKQMQIACSMAAKSLLLAVGNRFRQLAGELT